MIDLGSDVAVHVFSHATDMRKGFDSLSKLVREYGGSDVLSGGLFVFFSRRRDRVKVLYWEEDGYVLFYKRLEVGKFRVREKEEIVKVTGSELRLILQGMELERVKLRAKAQSGVFRKARAY
jgi:transposase